jgi:hypothetical protein
VYGLHIVLSILVFLLGLAALGYALRGVAGNLPYQKRMWDLAAYFAVSLYVQIVLGFLLIFSTTNRSFDRTLGLHMVLSVAAAALGHLTYASNRRRPREEREYALHVWGVGGALLLVIVGILVMRSPIFV